MHVRRWVHSWAHQTRSHVLETTFEDGSNLTHELSLSTTSGEQENLRVCVV
jgi:hypothetical protein